MGVPRDKDAKWFYQAAGQRLADAELLLEWERPAGVISLAGCCVDRALKAITLTQAPPGRRAEVLESFRGSGAHNYDRLRFLYNELGGT